MTNTHTGPHRSNALKRMHTYGLILALCFATLVLLPLAAHAQQPAGGSSIGGRFMLQDHTGKVVTDKAYQGRFMLITFGYTFCPDICPSNLANMATALDFLGPQAEQVTPIFVTVDPKRDSVERMRDYVQHFHPRMIGLTGPRTMIDSMVDRYNVIYAIHRPKGAGEDEYVVDHTAGIYLMSPDGDFIVKFAHGLDPEDMAKRIAGYMQK